MMIRRSLAFLALLAFAAPAAAAPRVEVTSKIWSQTVSFTLPDGFVTKFENTNGDEYIREAVLHGETVDQWTQMITVTGSRNLSEQDGVTPSKFAQTMANGFKRACPSTFSAQAIGKVKVSDYDAFEAIISCGSDPMTNGATSETAVVLVIEGEHDYYTLQWAVRGKPSSSPLNLDPGPWKARIARLQPITIE